MLNLDKPLVVFDLETTGVNTTKDRICSIAILKTMPDQTFVAKYRLINPKMPIPKEASDIHGITDDKVQGEPTFEQLANGVKEFIGDQCYIVGFNSKRFDMELLSEEFARCGISWPTAGIITLDAYEIYAHFNKRDLAAAYLHYTGKVLEGAHNSLEDSKATMEIFLKQLTAHEEFSGKSLSEIAKMFKPDNYVDDMGRILIDEEGNFIYGFGKSKGKKIKDDPDYGKWVLKSDFPTNIKNIIKQVLNGQW